MTTLEFVRLHPPRPLAPASLEGLLRRIASDPTSAPVVFEARSTRDPRTKQTLVSYWLGSLPEHARWLRRTFRDLLPGILIESGTGLERVPVDTAGRAIIRPPGLALSFDQPEAVGLGILSALNQGLAAEEALVLQVVIGPRRTPRHPKQHLQDPAQPWWQLVTKGREDAAAPVVRQHRDRVARAGMAACLRIGVTAATSRRRERLLAGMLGGISTAKAPGVFIRLRRDKVSRLNRGAPPLRWEFAPAADELVGLLGWPLGDRELPGLPPLHPRLLPVSAARRSLHASDRTLGESTAPGDPFPIELAPSDSLFHLVTTGPTGSGKSNAFLRLIASDIAAGRPVAVVDPKRQLIDDIVDRAIPRDRVHDVVIVDPSDSVVPGFNPLDVGTRDADVVVDGLLAVFAAVFAEGWGARSADITHAGLLSLARAGTARQGRSQPPYTLLDLPRLFGDASFRRTVIGHVASDPALGAFWAWYESLSPSGQASVIAAPSNKWRQYLMRPSVRRILGQPTPAFRLRDVFSGNKILLVPLNEGQIGPITAQLVGGLIVAELWAATLERAQERNPTARPASIWIDEVQNYLHLPTSLDAALNASRSMGVSWNMAHQFRAQVPAPMLAAIDSNARNKLVFRPGDPKDAVAYERMTPDLQAIDFMSLGRYEAYATVVASGAQQPWCSLRTYEPLKATGHGAAIRKASRTGYGGQETAPRVENEPQLDRSLPVGRRRRESRP